MILAMDEPRFPRTNPERWARERQYLTHDAAAAVAAFRRWREEVRATFAELSPEAWRRGGVHVDARGRRTLDEFLSVIAWHDDNHLDQLERALDGRP
jgi:N-methylhydantoinase B/oxoprolinase/acetone carboxylase alpha subunit